MEDPLIAAGASLATLGTVGAAAGIARAARALRQRRARAEIEARPEVVVSDAIEPDEPHYTDPHPTHGTLLGSSRGIIWTDGSLERFLGREPGSMHGTAWLDLMHPDDVPRCTAEAARGSGITSGRYQYAHARGPYLHVRWEWTWLCIGGEWVSICTWHDVESSARHERAVALLALLRAEAT